MSPSYLPTDCKLGRKTPVSRPATASQSRPAHGRRSTKNVLNKQNKVHYYKEKTARDRVGGDQSSKIRSGGEGPRRARSFLRKEPERGGRSPLRAAPGARTLAAREVDGGQYPRSEKPGTGGEHGAAGGPYCPPGSLASHRGALLRPPATSLRPHPPPLGPAARSARRSARLTGLTRRRSVRPACPPRQTIHPPTSPAPRRRLTCPSRRRRHRYARLSRPPGPEPRPPPASRPNADTKPTLIGHARHVTATLRRRQFQTAEQTESPRAGPHPRPGPGTPSPPSPPPPGSRDSPPRSRGLGQARRSEQRRAARSRRCSEVSGRLAGGPGPAGAESWLRPGGCGGLATVRRAAASSLPGPHPHLTSPTKPPSLSPGAGVPLSLLRWLPRLALSPEPRCSPF